MKLYRDQRDWYIGVYIGEHYYFIVFLTVVLRLERKHT